jgi:outer membrane protein assembly factor BamE
MSLKLFGDIVFVIALKCIFLMIRLTMQNCLKNTQKTLGRHLGLILLLASGLMAGCASSYSESFKTALGSTFRPYRPDMVQGNFISKEQASRLKLGMDREEIKVILGTPLLSDPMHANRWDYVFAFKRGRADIVEQRRVTLYFEKDVLAKIEGDELPTEHELIAEIDGIKGERRQPKTNLPELDAKSNGPAVQTVPNPTSGVGIPKGDTRN